MKRIILIVAVLFFCNTGYAQIKEVLIGTYLGNEKRNYYGNKAPNSLNLIWKLYLGEGISPAYGNPLKKWKGAGWTGQPLYIREDSADYLILGAFDYNLKKIHLATQKIIWEYKFDDIIKGTASFWINENDSNLETKYVIVQGSRRGYWNDINDKYIPSLRGISYITGKELWSLNSKRTESYSRDVDGSALIYNDTAYLALENGIFTVFDPNPNKIELRDDRLQAKVYNEIQYFTDYDVKFHKNDVVSESSPSLLNGVVYTASGSGHVYGYDIQKEKNVFDFYVGTDMDGSPAVTDDNCILISVEKQYMPGKGGVFKLDPSKEEKNAVIWYFPVENKKWYHWDGGIIGSVSVNDSYIEKDGVHIAAFVDVAGYLYIVRHDLIEKGKTVLGPDDKTKYQAPKLLFKEKIEGTISTPIIVGDKIIAATDKGLYLFKVHLNEMKIERLDFVPDMEIDATPIAVDGKIYVACRDGYLYCFGD
jgi:outer membrane protein assembly factor BamB